MDDQFDKKLSSRITEVFDQYEYPPASEGWSELRKKFPVKQERKIARLWWSSAAAALLVFLGIGLWMITRPDIAEHVVGYHQPKQQPKRDTALADPAHVSTQPGLVVKQGMPMANLKPDSAVKETHVIASTRQLNRRDAVFSGDQSLDGFVNNTQPTNSKGISLAPSLPTSAGANLNDPFAGKISVLPGSASKVNTGIASITEATAATRTPDTQQTAINNLGDQKIAKGGSPLTVNNTDPLAATQSAKAIDDLLRQDNPQRKNQTADKKDLKRVNFSVYAATYVNYAQGSSNQMNAGAGFTSDIRLGNNLKLSTGVLVAQNTLSYSSAPPLPAGKALAAAAPEVKATGFFNTSLTVAEFQNYNASLVGLDIPLNIKYEFNPQKSDAYISAGLSSGTFIDERYTYRYTYKTNGFTDKTANSQDQTTTSSFSNFYFARTLNISFGMGYPIGKNRLVIEPFLKYPLAGLGTQDLRFGAGGVNLKFSFKTSKK